MLSDAAHATLRDYVRDRADQLELRDWTVELHKDPPSSATAHGEMTAPSGQKYVNVWVCKDFRQLSPERQRHVVVHELVHAHFVAAQEQVEEDLEALLGKPADAVLFKSFRRSLEYGVDGIASALAKHLPLIEWPT